MGRGALAMEAAAVGGISSRALAPTEEQISAFLILRPVRGPRVQPARLSAVRSHRLQREAGHLAPIAITPVTPRPDSLLSPGRSNKAKSAAQPQEKRAPLKWLGVHQQHSAVSDCRQ